jgi:site-specific DNA-methyltransferase (adenine-specific)
MNFAVIIGNPPYTKSNNQIDFVTEAFNLSLAYVSMIIPSKWQAQGGNKNLTFRQTIVPYMTKIYYNPNISDIFPNIFMSGDGITYFLIDKHKLSTDTVINGINHKNWKPSYTLDNTCIHIVEKLSQLQLQSQSNTLLNSGIDEITPSKSYFTTRNFGDIPQDKEGNYIEDTTSRYKLRSSERCIKVSESNFRHIENMNKYKVYIGPYTTQNPVLHLVPPYTADVRTNCLLGFGTEEFCKSLISYYRCKLIWYLVYMTNSGTVSEESFINVPNPGKFDHIYTNKELYARYKITSDEIKIIESIIR